MTIINTNLGGTDCSNGEVLNAADLNDTYDAVAAGGLLGEVRMFAITMTGALSKANLQARGWAICDGTTPASQGISSPTIETTPNLENKFIRASDDETSGTEAGSDSHTHTVSVYGKYGYSSGTNDTVKGVAGVIVDVTNRDVWEDGTSGSTTTVPAYFELAFFLKVKHISGY